MPNDVVIIAGIAVEYDRRAAARVQYGRLRLLNDYASTELAVDEAMEASS